MSATVVLDKAGRLVLPKPIRDRLHLRAGSKLRLEVVGEKLELTQEATVVKIERRKDGLPVIVGWEGFDAAKAVQEMREDHLDRLAVPVIRQCCTDPGASLQRNGPSKKESFH